MDDLQQTQRECELLRAEIEQLRQTNKEMQETTHRSRIISDLVSDYTYAFRVQEDGHLVLEYCSDRFVELTGFTPEESEARGGWASICHPEDLGIAHARMERLFAGEDTISEFRILTRNGEARWLRDYGHPEWDAEKRHVVRIYGAVQDITEQKQLMNNLYDGEERFRSLASLAPVGVYFTDITGACLYANQCWLEIAGLTFEQAQGGGWAQALYVGDREWVCKAWQAMVASHGHWEQEYRFQKLTGEIIWVLGRASPLVDSSGQISGYIGVNMDITLRKEAAETQRESEEKLRTLFNSAGMGICLYTVDGTLININAKAVQHMGGKQEYYIGKSMLEIYGMQDGSRYLDRIMCAASTAEDQTYEDQVMLPTGLKWFQSTYSRILDNAGAVGGVQIITSDITPLKDALLEIQKAELKFRTIADYTNDWEIWESPTGTLRYMSPACLGITGYTAQEFLNDADLMLAIVAEEDRQDVLEHSRNKHKSMESMTMRYRIWHREGTIKWIEHMCQPVWDAEHHYLGRRISNRDISHRIAVTDALREREATLQALYQALPIPTYTWQKIGDDFVLTDFNKSAENATYGKIADLLGTKASVFYGGQPEILNNFAYCYAEKRTMELEWHNASQSMGIHSDLVFRFAYAPPNFILVHAEDVSERVKARLESQRYISTLQALRSIVRGILQTQSTREIAQSAADELCQLIDCECVGVLHFDVSLNKAVVLAVAGTVNSPEFQSATYLISQACSGLAELKKGMITRTVIQPHDCRSGCTFGINTREVIGFPLMTQKRLIGCLKLEFAEHNALPAQWEVFVAQVSDELAMVIQQANLREEMQDYIQNMESRIADRTREISTLYEIADIAGQTFDQQEMVQRILNRALKAMRCHMGAIHLLDATGGASDHLRLAASQGFSEEIVDKISFLPVSIEIINRVLNQDEPLVLDAFHSRLPESSQPFFIHWEHYLGVPIRTNTGPVGIVSVVRTRTQPQFTVEELALLTSIGAQIGRAVETDWLRIQAENAAVLQERARLGRELHDSVTQLLYSLTLFAEMASDANAAGESGTCQRSLERIGDIAYQVVREMRLLLYELMPSSLLNDGFVKALNRRLDSVERRAGIDVILEVEPCPFLTPSVELELYRIAQEALNNILLHAEADHIAVSLKREAGTMVLKIEDNGIGFSTEAVALRGGLGIKNMRERAERLNSRLDVHSNPGQGTRVQISVEVPDG